MGCTSQHKGEEKEREQLKNVAGDRDGLAMEEMCEMNEKTKTSCARAHTRRFAFKVFALPHS